jgi:ATP-dependent DNA helicase RecG
MRLPSASESTGTEMEWLEVLQRIRGGETDETELKRSYDTTKLGPAACAMANSTGGIVVLGVEDDGTIVGVKSPNTVYEQVTSFLQNGLSSPLSARVGRAEDPNGTVLWIELPRQRGYEPMRFKGIVYVRRARSSVEPSSSELQDLYNLFGYIVTEERVIEDATEKEIESGIFERFMTNMGLALDDEPRLDFATDLRNRGILAERGDQLRATVYGVMCFGKRPQGYSQTTRFRIDASVYRGVDRGEADDVTVSSLDGRLDEQVERAVDWLKRLGRVESYATSTNGTVERTERYRLPLDAFREAVVNAVAHRDYGILGSQILIDAFDDRIEITSPGSLPNHMDVASAMAGGNPRARNQAMANFCVVMKLMETRGRGFPRMRSAMKKFNGTVPQLSNDRDARFVRVTFDTRPAAAPPDADAGA